MQRVVATLQQRSWWGRAAAPRLAVIVNPHAGKGSGRRVLDEMVLPVLRDVAGMHITVQVRAPHPTPTRMHVLLHRHHARPTCVRAVLPLPPDPHESFITVLPRQPPRVGSARVRHSGAHCDPVLALQETRGRMHAAELVAALDLSSTDLLLYIGGDGTMYEGLQVGWGGHKQRQG